MGASGTSRPTPSPGGLPTSLWASAPPGATRVQDTSAQRMVAGDSTVREFLWSHSAALPKGGFAEDVEVVLRRVCAIRPIRLMNTSAKLAAAGGGLSASS